MHPEIVNFWEKLGKIDTDVLMSAPVSVLFWCVIYTGTTEYTYIASKPSDTETVTYYINNSFPDYGYSKNGFTEVEMLRMIRLKAFL